MKFGTMVFHAQPIQLLDKLVLIIFPPMSYVIFIFSFIFNIGIYDESANFFFNFYFLFFYIYIFGCVGSLFLCEGFL